MSKHNSLLKLWSFIKIIALSMGIGKKVNVWTNVFGYVPAVNFLVKPLLRLNYINTVRIAALEWTAMQMINIIGAFVTLMGAFAFGWMGNLPMTIAMLAGVIYFKEYK